MLAFHCLLLVLLAGQASAGQASADALCERSPDNNPSCITQVCKAFWPKDSSAPADLTEVRKRFFAEDTSFEEWKSNQNHSAPEVNQCTIFAQTTDYRNLMNAIVGCKPWGTENGQEKTWCLCEDPSPSVSSRCGDHIMKMFNSQSSCGAKELGCDPKSLYDVEHIIDKNGHEHKQPGAGHPNIYGNVVMAWADWNQQLGKCAETNYADMQAEKQMIYGATLWGQARQATIECGKKDTQPSPGMSKAVLVLASLPDNNGNTPLVAAAKNGHVEVVEALLASNQVNPNEHSADGRTALFMAAETGHLYVVEALLADDQVDPNQPSADGRTPLFMAAENGHLYVVEALLADDQVDPNQPSPDGRTPLFTAAENGHLSVVRALLAHRATDHTASGSENGVA